MSCLKLYTAPHDCEPVILGFPSTADTAPIDAEELTAVLDRARLISSRAMGGWPKILPRLRSCLEDQGELLVWAGDEVETIARRQVWRRFDLEEKRLLPDRERSWIWRFRLAEQVAR